MTPVRIRSSADTVAAGQSEDISEGGLLVATAARFDDGDRVEVELALPTTGRIVRVAAIARWARAARRVGAVGLELVEVPSEVRASIAWYVATMGAGG